MRNEREKNAVLMVPGLAEASCLLAPLAAVLRVAGYRPILFDYPSTRHTIEVLTEDYLGPAIAALRREKRLDIVTHSMGGVMLRYYLQRHGIPNLGRAVMLAPGHGGSPMSSLYRHHPLYPLMLGPAGVQSSADEAGFALRIPRRVEAEVGVIAGCMPLDPLSLFVMPWPHDGRLPVDSTAIAGMRDHIVLPASHDFLMLDPWACYETLHFLDHGIFDHGPLLVRCCEELIRMEAPMVDRLSKRGEEEAPLRKRTPLSRARRITPPATAM